MSESKTIAVRCPCGTKLRLPAAAAGKKAKCPKCAKVFRVPGGTPAPTASAPATPAPAPDQSDGGLLDELAAMERSAAPEEGSRTFSGKVPCVQCGAAMDGNARLCIHCGYDTATGKKVKQASARKANASAAVRKAASGAGQFLLGTALSGVGALVGAGIWCAIALASGYEIGWIAWGVGLLAGFGMRLGYRNENVRAGLVAACMALVGLVAGKVMIFAFLIYAMVSGNTSNQVIQRVLVADGIVQEMLDQREIYDEDMRDAKYDSLYPAAEKQAERMSDEELQRKFDENRRIAMGPEDKEIQVWELADHHATQEANKTGLAYDDPEREGLVEKYQEQFTGYSEAELAVAWSDLEEWHETGRWEDAAYLREALIDSYVWEMWEGDDDPSGVSWTVARERAVAKVDTIPPEQHAAELRKLEEPDRIAAEAMDAELSAELAGDVVSEFFAGAFSLIDIFFCLLAVGSAYGLASGGRNA